MKKPARLYGAAALAFAACAAAICSAQTQDPLPSWAPGPAKQAILTFIRDVTTAGGPRYVPPEERVAAFDNDGTLWIEKPHYVEVMYLLDHIGKHAREHPAWEGTQPFKDILKGKHDFLELLEAPEMMKIVFDTFAGMTAGEFEREAGAWLRTATHPRFKRRYTELVYTPQIELMNHLRRSGFKTYLCTGGGVDFLRIFCEGTYGVPLENVIGSHPKMEFREKEGVYHIFRVLGEALVNVDENKPIDIELHVGRRPILAFGNSDGDIEMLEWTESKERPFLSLLLSHDDPVREYSYTKHAEKALGLAEKRPWTLVSMKGDWRRVFAFEEKR